MSWNKKGCGGGQWSGNARGGGGGGRGSGGGSQRAHRDHYWEERAPPVDDAPTIQGGSRTTLTDPSVNYRILPSEQMLTCPYESSHKITGDRFNGHIAKCKKNYEKKVAYENIPVPERIASCVFCSEFMKNKELREHQRTCPKNPKVEAQMESMLNDMLKSQEDPFAPAPSSSTEYPVDPDAGTYGRNSSSGPGFWAAGAKTYNEDIKFKEKPEKRRKEREGKPPPAFYIPDGDENWDDEPEPSNNNGTEGGRPQNGTTSTWGGKGTYNPKAYIREYRQSADDALLITNPTLLSKAERRAHRDKLKEERLVEDPEEDEKKYIPGLNYADGSGPSNGPQQSSSRSAAGPSPRYSAGHSPRSSAGPSPSASAWSSPGVVVKNEGEGPFPIFPYRQYPPPKARRETQVGCPGWAPEWEADAIEIPCTPIPQGVGRGRGIAPQSQGSSYASTLMGPPSFGPPQAQAPGFPVRARGRGRGRGIVKNEDEDGFY